MASQIQLTRSGISGVQPGANELEYGELALNYADGKLFYRDVADNLKAVNDTYQNSNNTIYVNSTNSAEPKIGLKTTGPQYLLDLGGDTGSAHNTLRINQTTSGTAIRIGSDDEDITLLRVDNADGETANSADGFSIKYLGSNSNNELGIFADNSGTEVQALTILQDGKVGIGSATITNQLLLGDEWDTNSPSGGNKIYIKDSDSSSNYDPLGSASDGNQNTTSNKNEFPLLISNNSSAVGNPTSHGILLYNANGGAGTFAPSILFGSRESDAEVNGQYRAATGAIYCRTPLGVGGATNGTYGDGELIFATAGTLNGSSSNSQGLSQRMVIDRSGNVGIGIATPLAPLHIDQKIAGAPALILQGADPGLHFLDDTDQTQTMRMRYNGADGVSGMRFTMFDDTTSTQGATVFEIDTNGDVTASGNVTADDPTADTHLTTKAYVDGRITAEEYRPGEIIECVSGSADGRSITATSGTYILENITAKQSLTTTTTYITGSRINYLPPVGAKCVEYCFKFHWEATALSGISSYKLYIESDTPETVKVTNNVSNDTTVVIEEIDGTNINIKHARKLKSKLTGTGIPAGTTIVSETYTGGASTATIVLSQAVSLSAGDTFEIAKDVEVKRAFKSIASDYNGHHHANRSEEMIWNFDLTAATDDLDNGKLTSWTTAREIKIAGREHDGSYHAAIHSNSWRNNDIGHSGASTDTEGHNFNIHTPNLKVIAIA